MRLQYHVIAGANIEKQIGPLIQSFLSYESATPMERLKIAFGRGGLRMEKLLDGLSRGKISALAKAASPISSKSIRSLQVEMNSQIYRLMLAETLDLIGIISTISGQDVTSLSKEEIQELIRSNPIVRDLISFSAQIVFH